VPCSSWGLGRPGRYLRKKHGDACSGVGCVAWYQRNTCTGQTSKYYYKEALGADSRNCSVVGVSPERR
jgi:hypothetical protein